MDFRQVHHSTLAHIVLGAEDSFGSDVQSQEMLASGRGCSVLTHAVLIAKGCLGGRR